MKYTAAEVLRVAKRFKNTRRNYLLVNPLQGKHLPVRPTVALEMMNSLGQLVAEKSAARLVVGFAETATAIGAVVAKNLSDDCFYLQTTRENFSGNFVEFLEEHSHAPEQKLFADNLSTLIDGTPEVVFVDDELSTGKTLRNIVRQLKKSFPALGGKKICAASIINRLSDENLAALADENISCVSLVKLNETFDASNFQVTEAQSVAPDKKTCPLSLVPCPLKDPRKGVEVGKYFAQCDAAGNFVVDLLKRENISGDVLILGTEEFMLPAIVAGQKLEAENFSVVTHSTTRSPIGICDAENYPIRAGFKIRSFYNATRTTFVYNLRHYDAAVVMTNAQNFSAGVDDLISALNVHGVKKIFIVRC